MPETLASGSGDKTVNPALLALRPRQVVLTTLHMKQTKPNGSADNKALLLHSVAHFLGKNGFSKTLKKFRSEAEIETDALKGSLLDLEELVSKYFNMCDDAKINFKGQKDQELKRMELLPEVTEKNKEKKKKKNNFVSDSEPMTSATEEKIKDASLGDKNATDSRRDKKTKDKEKKNKLPTSDSLINNADSQAVEEKISKSKTKKKKKGDLAFETSGVNSKDTSVIGSKGDDKMSSADADATGSKKRKRLVPDETDLKPVDRTEVEESKRRKIEGVDSKGNEQQTNVNASADINKIDKLQNNSINQDNGRENGNIGKSAEKSSIEKSAKKQQNGSAEPKTVNAFQRVKVDEVVFTDERLKDNSYWAKDGAETGYGAKAQEVLGQVKGRDFRHEKTKKKRGSYRGGYIDLQSHSVKFNYSDDE